MERQDGQGDSVVSPVVVTSFPDFFPISRLEAEAVNINNELNKSRPIGNNNLGYRFVEVKLPEGGEGSFQGEEGETGLPAPSAPQKGEQIDPKSPVKDMEPLVEEEVNDSETDDAMASEMEDGFASISEGEELSEGDVFGSEDEMIMDLDLPQEDLLYHTAEEDDNSEDPVRISFEKSPTPLQVHTEEPRVNSKSLRMERRGVHRVPTSLAGVRAGSSYHSNDDTNPNVISAAQRQSLVASDERDTVEQFASWKTKRKKMESSPVQEPAVERDTEQESNTTGSSFPSAIRNILGKGPLSTEWSVPVDDERRIKFMRSFGSLLSL